MAKPIVLCISVLAVLEGVVFVGMICYQIIGIHGNVFCCLHFAAQGSGLVEDRTKFPTDKDQHSSLYCNI